MEPVKVQLTPIGTRIELQRTDPRVELTSVGPRIELERVAGKISEKREQELTKRCQDLSKDLAWAAKWRNRLPQCARLSVLLFCLSAYLLRVGLLAHQLRLASLGFKGMGAGLLILGFGANRQQTSEQKVNSDCEKLKKRVKKWLGDEKGPPKTERDLQSVEGVYRQHLARVPWILRYCPTEKVAPDLPGRVWAATLGLERLRKEETRAYWKSRTAVGLTCVGLAGVVWSVTMAQAVALGLSYGLGLSFTLMAMALSFSAPYRQVKRSIRQAEALANQAAKHVPDLAAQHPRAVTRLQLGEESGELASYPHLKRLKTANWPSRLPPKLTKLAVEADVAQLSVLPSTVRTFEAGAYSGGEQLRRLGLETVRLKRCDRVGLDSLATLWGLRELRIDKLPTLDHQLLRQIRTLTTKRLPASSEDVRKQSQLRKLTLTEPTLGCLNAVKDFGVLRELTLERDVGITKALLDDLFVSADLQRLEVKGWSNQGGILLQELEELWDSCDFFRDGDEVKKKDLGELVGGSSCRLVIRPS